MGPNAVVVYEGTNAVAWIEGDTFELSWKAAVSDVKSRAHVEGREGGVGYYVTARRVGFERGNFRCTSVFPSR